MTTVHRFPQGHRRPLAGNPAALALGPEPPPVRAAPWHAKRTEITCDDARSSFAFLGCGPSARTPNGHHGDWYEIRVQGRLDDRWSTWLDDLDLSHTTDGTTVLRGPVADQAALHGLLHKVRDLGLPCFPSPRPTPRTAIDLIDAHPTLDQPVPPTRRRA